MVGATFQLGRTFGNGFDVPNMRLIRVRGRSLAKRPPMRKRDTPSLADVHPGVEKTKPLRIAWVKAAPPRQCSARPKNLSQRLSWPTARERE